MWFTGLPIYDVTLGHIHQLLLNTELHQIVWSQLCTVLSNNMGALSKTFIHHLAHPSHPLINLSSFATDKCSFPNCTVKALGTICCLPKNSMRHRAESGGARLERPCSGFVQPAAALHAHVCGGSSRPLCSSLGVGGRVSTVTACITHCSNGCSPKSDPGLGALLRVPSAGEPAQDRVLGTDIPGLCLICNRVNWSLPQSISFIHIK